MTALYGPNSINLPHIDLYKWAADRKLILPLDMRQTPEQEKMFLKLLAMKQYFVKMSPEKQKARFAAAVEESMKYLPSKGGLSDRSIIVLQIAGAIFIAVIYFTNKNAKL